MKSLTNMSKQELIDLIVDHLKTCNKLDLRCYIRERLDMDYKEKDPVQAKKGLIYVGRKPSKKKWGSRWQKEE